MAAALPESHDTLQKSVEQQSSVRNIVLPLDGSTASRRALPIGRYLAQLYRAPLHVLYAAEHRFSPREVIEHLGLTDADLRGAIVDQDREDAAQAILTCSHGLDRAVIVMCTNTGHHIGPDCFGSVTEAVLAGTPDRIVLVAERDEQPWEIHRVLLAHDGTPSSDLATAPAAELAQRAGATVIAIHVAARGEQYSDEPGSMPAPRYIDQPQHEWPSWANQFMNRMLALGAPPSSVSFKLVVTGGQAGSEVAQVSRERQADLVVMAWHGRWDAPQSATKVVIRSAGCPVLLVYSRNE
ncbi:MAG TPA: universal stress protein [Terriglobales bacterium]|nr:universal stress protein [Terriglobales bacterium]